MALGKKKKNRKTVQKEKICAFDTFLLLSLSLSLWRSFDFINWRLVVWRAPEITLEKKKRNEWRDFQLAAAAVKQNTNKIKQNKNKYSFASAIASHLQCWTHHDRGEEGIRQFSTLEIASSQRNSAWKEERKKKKGNWQLFLFLSLRHPFKLLFFPCFFFFFFHCLTWLPRTFDGRKSFLARSFDYFVLC